MFSLVGYNSRSDTCLVPGDMSPALGENPYRQSFNFVTITEMSIQIKLFATLADEIGKRAGTMDYEEGLTVASLWSSFSGQSEIPNGVLCAINYDYAEPDQLLNDGDEIAFFPPVTGG